MPEIIDNLSDKELDKALDKVCKTMFGTKLDRDYKTHAKIYKCLLREKAHRAKKLQDRACHS